MDSYSYAALAPRQGTRPMLNSWSSIGTHEMHGGAFNWGSLWSGIKNFGGTVKNWGSRVWHSDAGQALRNQLKKTGLQEKIIEGVSTGIHGALDIGRQRLEKAIEQRLERRPVPEAAEELQEAPAAVIEEVEDAPPPPYSAAAPVAAPAVVPVVTTPAKTPLSVALPPKRGRDEAQELVIRHREPPPPYEEVMTAPAPALVAHQGVLKNVPVTQPAQPFSPAVHETERIIAPLPITTVTRRRGWQSTLNDIVGLGVHAVKRRRCY